MKFLLLSALIYFLGIEQTRAAADEPGRAEASSTNIDVSSEIWSGHRVEISLRSIGCFHQDRYHVILGPDGSEVTGIGSVKVHRVELQYLDNYLNAVRRRGSSGGCTTTDQFEISVWRGETRIKKESLADYSCVTMSRARNSNPHPIWMPLTRIVARAEAANLTPRP